MGLCYKVLVHPFSSDFFALMGEGGIKEGASLLILEGKG